ncbi:hypothetical protein, partial [Streptomyces parvus]|uniref:hypothetical protein n=1 Tax=Streptomyces parvus TaxID=66428 RepID=UPI00331CC88D
AFFLGGQALGWDFSPGRGAACAPGPPPVSRSADQPISLCSTGTLSPKEPKAAATAVGTDLAVPEQKTGWLSRLRR